MKPCKEWPGKLDKDGYGRTSVGGRKGKTVRVHRLAWEKVNGPIPPGMCVLHHCDNPPCYEETHLFLGTRPDNSADAVAKGRQVNNERHGMVKLTDQEITTIRSRLAAGETGSALAAEYGVVKQHISKIKLGQTR